MELGDVNSGESSKNQQVEIQVEGNIQFSYNKYKIDLKSSSKTCEFPSCFFDRFCIEKICNNYGIFLYSIIYG